MADEPGYTSVAYITDHLGSVRVVVGADGTVIKHNEFLPYGELFNNNDPYLTNNDLLYGGKELQKKFGINLYDFQARFQANTGMFLSLDPLAEKFYGISPYSYCAGNPVNFTDKGGDSLKVNDLASLEALYNAIPKGVDVSITMKNGCIDPSSIVSSNDLFLQDLLTIASDETMVILETLSSFDYIDANGNRKTQTFETPQDVDDKSLGVFPLENEPYGLHINGNLGQSLFPDNQVKKPVDGIIHIIINAKGTINQRSVGIAHEFGHVVPYLKGKPYSHPNPDVDMGINSRTTLVSRRLGYDY